jgi:hypothetical protein
MAIKQNVTEKVNSSNIIFGLPICYNKPWNMAVRTLAYPDRDVLTDRGQLGKRNTPEIPQSGVKDTD